MAEYADLVEQALIEVDEMRHIVAYETDGEDLSSLAFIEPLEAELKRLKDALATDTYDFRDEDLGIVTCLSREEYDGLPFKYLLDMINTTHRQGLETGE